MPINQLRPRPRKELHGYRGRWDCIFAVESPLFMVGASAGSFAARRLVKLFARIGVYVSRWLGSLMVAGGADLVHS